jgi:hypothetical protein
MVVQFEVTKWEVRADVENSLVTLEKTGVVDGGHLEKSQADAR